MKSIYYWSPFFSDIATEKAVLNSIIAVKKYSKNQFRPYLINVFGEWDVHHEILKRYDIDIINFRLNNFFKKRKINGFLKSRVYQIKIFILGFFPLIKILKKNKPDFIIIHLVTSLPLFINFFFNLKTKFILRISGLPKLNILRNLYWKIVLDKINIITTPTVATKIYLKNLFPNLKISILKDPIIFNETLFVKQKKKEKNNFYISIGRLTKQKNFLFLIKTFKKIVDKNSKNKLYILGDGEQYKKLYNYIKLNNLENNIFLKGYKKNIYNYLYSSKAFILSSLWEDPGFVLVEAAYANIPIISSDCKNGPIEILNNGRNGYLFNSNNQDSLVHTINKFESSNIKEILKKKIYAKKMSKNFSIFRHYIKLKKILEYIK
jgi:glycosyltransferase involved in cell wall biosynthesis